MQYGTVERESAALPTCYYVNIVQWSNLQQEMADVAGMKGERCSVVIL